jgi:hypothetical protein
MHNKSQEEEVLMELGTTRQIVDREMVMFADPLVTEAEKNRRLMFLFVKDLMDGVNGAILDTKDRRDHGSIKRVPMYYKISAWSFLVLMASAMLLYIYLFAMRQSASRQNAWFRSFMVWLVFEIFLASTAVVLIHHVFLPLCAIGNVRRIKKQIVHDIIKFNSKVRNIHEVASPQHTGFTLNALHGPEENCTFNAAEFLFPSYRLAMLNEYLPDSPVVLKYSTPWPKKSFSGGETVKSNYDMRFAFAMQSLSRVLVFLLVGFIKLPESARDSVVELVSTVGLGYLVIVHVKLFKIHPALVIVPSLLMILIVVLLTSACARSSKLDLNRDFDSEDRASGIVSVGDINSSQPASHQLGKAPKNGLDACSAMNAEQEIRGPTVASSGRLKTRKVSVENIEIVNKRLLTEGGVAGVASTRGNKKEENMKIISQISSLALDLFDGEEMKQDGDTWDLDDALLAELTNITARRNSGLSAESKQGGVYSGEEQPTAVQWGSGGDSQEDEDHCLGADDLVLEEADCDEKNMWESSDGEVEDDMQDWESALEHIKERAIGRTVVSVGDDLVLDGDEKNMLESSDGEDEEEEDDMQDWESALEHIKEWSNRGIVSTDVKMEQEQEQQKERRRDEFDDDDDDVSDSP